MDNNELLLAISTMLDTKLDAKLARITKDMQNLKSDMQNMKSDMKDMKSDMRDSKLRVQRIEVDLLENDVIPRLNTIEACYTSTFDRYKDSVEDHETMKQDIEVIKKVVTGHSEKLQKIS